MQLSEYHISVGVQKPITYPQIYLRSNINPLFWKQFLQLVHLSHLKKSSCQITSTWKAIMTVCPEAYAIAGRLKCGVGRTAVVKKKSEEMITQQRESKRLLQSTKIIL